VKSAVLLIAVLLITPALAADPPKLPDGYTCEDVRAKVAEHGWFIAYAWAKLHGYSKGEIAAHSPRCCGHRFGSIVVKNGLPFSSAPRANASA
jgi:hypothetical protein